MPDVFDLIAMQEYKAALDIMYKKVDPENPDEELKKKIRHCQLRLANVLDLRSCGLGYSNLSGEVLTEAEAETKLARWQARNKKTMPQGATKGAIHMAKVTKSAGTEKRGPGRPTLKVSTRTICERHFNRKNPCFDFEVISEAVTKKLGTKTLTRGSLAVYKSAWKKEQRAIQAAIKKQGS